MAKKMGDARRVVGYALDSPCLSFQTNLEGEHAPISQTRKQARETVTLTESRLLLWSTGLLLLVCFLGIGAPKPGPTHARQVLCPGLHLPFHLVSLSSYSNLDISLQMLPVQTSDKHWKYSSKLNHCREKMFLVCSLNTLIPLNCCVAFNLFEYNAKSIF